VPLSQLCSEDADYVLARNIVAKMPLGARPVPLPISVTEYNICALQVLLPRMCLRLSSAQWGNQFARSPETLMSHRDMFLIPRQYM